MKIIIFLLFFVSSVLSQQIIHPYVNQCPGNPARLYEKNFPCHWKNYVLVWDFQPIPFICNNVPSSYNYNYTITNNQPNNIQSFSVALFDRIIDDTVVLSGFIDVNNNYNRWSSANPDVRFNADFFTQPLNSPFSSDFSGTNQVVVSNPPSVVERVTNNLKMTAFFINRENLSSQFPCFDLTVSFNVF